MQGLAEAAHLRVVGRDAVPDQAERGGQPVDEVDGDRDVVLTGQRVGGVDARRPGTDDGDAQGMARGGGGRRTVVGHVRHPDPAGASAPDQVQALFRSNPLTMYWVSVTRPPGVSAGLRQSARASDSELEPASQLGRLARLLVEGTLPTICAHCRSVEYRPTSAAAGDASTRSCPRASPGCGPARRTSRSARCWSSRRRATRRSWTARCRPGPRGRRAGRTTGCCCWPAPSRTARSRPSCSSPSHSP